MKTAKTIRYIIDLFLLGYILISCKVILDIISSLRQESTYDSAILDSNSISVLFSHLLSFLYITLFFLGIYFLRQAIKSMVNGKLFYTSVINNLKKSGTYFLLVSGSAFLLYAFAIFNTYSKGKGFEVSYEGLAIILLIIFGLFIRLCATVFNKGKALKEENKLTI